MSIHSIPDLAASLDIAPEHLLPFGEGKAKVRLAARDSGRPKGKLILVSAITPTKAGEGKTTVSIGLAQGMAKIGQRVCLALREPSLGPVFGVKGGATGGGKSVLVPSEDINLHFTGDMHAITSAHNLLTALMDNHLHFGLEPVIDPRRVIWRRVLDLNDRALRNVVVGLGGITEGMPRQTGFDITPASEVMAVLCLSEDEDDLRARLSRLVVAETPDRQPVRAADLDVVGAMMALLRDAMMPNLVQTGEGVPALVHGGPFANIAHGCNSVIATKMALSVADWVITEAGFGFDLGAEKFFDIKCRSAGLDPAAVVLVATCRALKMHGGVRQKNLNQANPEAVAAGLPNLRKHVESIRCFNENPIIALNRFASDTDEEIAIVRAAAAELGVPFAVSDGFNSGGDGVTELAEALVAQCENEVGHFKPLYELSETPAEKMLKIAKSIYGADGVIWSKQAKRDLRRYKRWGHEGLPLCVAKTQSSLSDDPTVVGAPTGFEVQVRNVVLAAGAGYLVPMLGDIVRMPGLPKVPASEAIDLVDGKITGLS